MIFFQSLIYSFLLISTISLPWFLSNSYTQIIPLFLSLAIIFIKSLRFLILKKRYLIFVIPLIFLVYCSLIDGFNFRFFTSYYLYLISLPVYYIFLKSISQSSKKQFLSYKKILLSSFNP